MGNVIQVPLERWNQKYPKGISYKEASSLQIKLLIQEIEHSYNRGLISAQEAERRYGEIGAALKEDKK